MFTTRGTNFDKMIDKMFDNIAEPIWKSVYFTESDNVKYVSTKDGVKFALPGFSKEDIKMEVANGSLKIESIIEKSEDAFRNPFTITWQLPMNVDTDTINAKMEHGILEVTYSNKDKKTSKEINIL